MSRNTDSETERLLRALMDERDPQTWAQLLRAYYSDADRADNTSREVMYLHLGMAVGILLRNS